MKKTALLAAAAALFMATPAMAQSGGHVGLNFGNTETDTDDFDTWQGDVALGGAHGAVGFQVDGGFGSSDSGGTDVDHYTVAGHLYWNGGGWRLGGVVAHTTLDGDGDSVGETVYGVEGTLDLGANAVLLGSYTVGESEFIVDLDSSNADIGLNYYFTDNLRAGVNAGTGNLDAGSGDFDSSSLGINAEWQPWAMPLSFRAAYNTFEVDDVFGDFETLTLGARWNWGGTLRERDNATPFDTRTGLYQRVYGIQ